MTRHAEKRHRQEPPDRSWWKRLHRDWRAWLAVALMFLGIVAYVMTLDDAVQPGKPLQNPVPAAP